MHEYRCLKMRIIVKSCVSGYHVYQRMWTLVIGKYLPCKEERGNTVDRHVVVVCKPEGMLANYVPDIIFILVLSI